MADGHGKYIFYGLMFLGIFFFVVYIIYETRKKFEEVMDFMERTSKKKKKLWLFKFLNFE